MDDREFEKILASAEQLRLREKEPEPWADRYSDMNSMEKSMLFDELFSLRKADKAEREQLLALNENSQRLLRQNDELKRMLSDRDALIEKLRKENAALKEQKKLSDKNRFDGSSTPNLPSEEAGTDIPSSVERKQERPYRKGMSYKRMKADKSVRHDFDFCRLPKEAVIIKTFHKYSYEQVSYILEHKYQVVRYKLPDGRICEGYLSKDGGPDYMDVVPGTHASADFLAHARAKFVYAYEQGGDLNAKQMLEYIGWLYGQEDSYRQSGLTAEEVTRQWNFLRTKDVIGRMCSFLNVLTSEGHPSRGDLMEKAVNYLKNFWNQLFAYLKDGRYSIDNTIAERFIRPLAGERKNSLFFGSNRMANVSAAYHTLISTCRANGISALAYLKKFFREVAKGRRDYENLLPMTIGINTNKFKKSSPVFENFKRKASQRGFPYRVRQNWTLTHFPLCLYCIYVLTVTL